MASSSGPMSNVMSQQQVMPFSKLGVKLSYFDEFISTVCKCSANIMGKTTKQVCDDFVKPLTSASQMSLCDLLLGQGHPAIGTATVFISHAWLYNFLDVVDALKTHFVSSPDIIVWFDLFSNNQSEQIIKTNTDFSWWCGVFMSAISSFGRVVMVLSPWNDPETLKRAWCLFEVYCSNKTNCVFEVAFSVEQKKLFFEAIMDDAEMHINNMLAKIDCENSQCFDKTDREKIFDKVRREIGFGTVNSLVFEQLRRWVIQATKDELGFSRLACLNIKSSSSKLIGGGCGSIDEEARCLKLENALAELYCGQGIFQEAESLCKHCFESRKDMLGEGHISTLSSMHNLSCILERQGKYHEAEILCQQCLDLRSLAFKDEHRDTLVSMNALAHCKMNLGKYDQAKELLEQCLRIRISNLSENHVDTMASINSLASLCEAMGDYEEAERLFLKCRDLREAKLSKTHPDTLSTINSLASLYVEQCRYEEAEKLYINIIELSKVKLGQENPTTLAYSNNLANCLLDQERYGEAESILKVCVDQCIQKLGQDHPETLCMRCNLAVFYKHTDRIAEAEVIYSDCFERCKTSKSLGQDHPDTLATMDSLAQVYYWQERYTEAEPMFEFILAARRRIFPDGHPSTLMSMNNMACLYEQQNKFDEAKELYSACIAIKKKTFGEGHIETLRSMNNLALLHNKMNNYALAEPLLETCVYLGSSNSNLGERHGTVLIFMESLAICYLKQLKFDNSEVYLKKCADICAVGQADYEHYQNRLAYFKRQKEAYTLGLVATAASLLQVRSEPPENLGSNTSDVTNS